MVLDNRKYNECVLFYFSAYKKYTSKFKSPYFRGSLNIKKSMKDENFILMIIRDGCDYSKEQLQDFVQIYNTSNCEFSKLPI